MDLIRKLEPCVGQSNQSYRNSSNQIMVAVDKHIIRTNVTADTQIGRSVLNGMQALKYRGVFNK